MAKQTSLKSFFQRPNATDEGEPSDEDEPVIPEAIDVRTAPPEKRPKCRAFRSEWSDKFPWLRCEVIDGNDNIFCSHCEKAGRRNGFTRGSNHFRISALIKHSQRNDHVAALNLTPQQVAIKGHLLTRIRHSCFFSHCKLSQINMLHSIRPDYVIL